MISISDKPEDSKSLYFSLNNSFLISRFRVSSTLKLPGVYAIFKDKVCYYVGQSKNIASRLATHLNGKYKNADEILIYTAYEHISDDFYTLHKDDQSHLLLLNEDILIDIFKPVENILTEYTVNNEYNVVFDIFEAYQNIGDLIQYCPLRIYVTDQSLCVRTGDVYMDSKALKTIYSKTMDTVISRGYFDKNYGDYKYNGDI